MLERCFEFFLVEPRRLMQLGRALLQFGLVLFVAGVAGATATTAVSVVTGMATKSRPTVALSDVVTGLPTWWVPESVIGYGFVLCCGAFGAWAMHAGRTYQRLLRP